MNIRQLLFDAFGNDRRCNWLSINECIELDDDEEIQRYIPRAQTIVDNLPPHLLDVIDRRYPDPPAKQPTYRSIAASVTNIVTGEVGVSPNTIKLRVDRTFRILRDRWRRLYIMRPTDECVYKWSNALYNMAVTDDNWINDLVLVIARPSVNTKSKIRLVDEVEFLANPSIKKALRLWARIMGYNDRYVFLGGSFVVGMIQDKICFLLNRTDMINHVLLLATVKTDSGELVSATFDKFDQQLIQETLNRAFVTGTLAGHYIQVTE